MSAQDRTKPNASDYKPPAIRSFTTAELLEILGPAQGYGGPAGGLEGGTSITRTLGKV